MTRSRRTSSFRYLCTVLDAALAGDTMPPSGVDPGLPDWPALIRLSGTHLVTPAFGLALGQLGLLPDLDPELRTYFDAMGEAARARELRLRRDLGEIVRTLGSADVPVLLLKGSIRLLDGLYPAAGWRFMHDLDLLVPEERIVAAQQALERDGWRAIATDHGPSATHLPRMKHPEGEAVLELHHRVAPPRFASLLETSSLFARSLRGTCDGRPVRLPTPEDQLIHLVLHGQEMHGHLYTGRLLLRDMMELARLRQRYGHACIRRAQQRLACEGFGLAGEVAWLGAALTLPRAVGPVPDLSARAQLLARRCLAQQRSPLLNRILAPIGGLVREWHAQRGRRGLWLRPSYYGRLVHQLRGFHRKTSW